MSGISFKNQKMWLTMNSNWQKISAVRAEQGFPLEVLDGVPNSPQLPGVGAEAGKKGWRLMVKGLGLTFEVRKCPRV